MVEIQRLASGAVGRVLAGRSLDAELAAVWSREPRLGERERAAIRDLAYGTLRYLGRFEALLDELLERPLRDDAVASPPADGALPARAHPRRARTRSSITRSNAPRGWDFPRRAGLVNAVLRNFLRSRARLTPRVVRLETARYSHPQWWIDRVRAAYPQRYESVLEAGCQHPPLTLRVNRRRATPAEYLGLLEERAVPATLIGESAVRLETPLPVGRIPGFAEGLVSVQDAAAQLAAPLLALEDGQRVLDACAAPGGKTTHMLELADASVTALDADAQRLERVRANLARLGFAAQLVCGDAGEPAAWWDGEPYDRILADVPCTASGIARRHPDVKWLRRPVRRRAVRARAAAHARCAVATAAQRW